MDPRLKLAQLRASKPDAQKVAAFIHGDATLGEALQLDASTRVALLRSAHAKLTAGDAQGALELAEFLLSIDQDDVLTIICWAQAHAALRRYGEAVAINDVAIALAESGKMTALADDCRAWGVELAGLVANQRLR